MKIEKYNISLEREFLRINSKNKLTHKKGTVFLPVRVRKINCVNAKSLKFLTILKVQPKVATLRSDQTQAVR